MELHEVASRRRNYNTFHTNEFNPSRAVRNMRMTLKRVQFKHDQKKNKDEAAGVFSDDEHDFNDTGFVDT